AHLYDLSGEKGALVQAKKAISLQLKKRSGANLLAIVAAAEEIVREFTASSEVHIIKTLDTSDQVNMMLSDLENNIATALILVVFVIFVGMGVRNALLVALCIPFSMFISFVVLSMMGETLNMMVLFSLILALGMLVDNAIVIVENIYRHYTLGKSRLEAAVEGTREMTLPVVASTATTVGAFVPMLFWPDVMGQVMSYLPLTVIVVLLSSLFVALVINPTMTMIFMKRLPGADTSFDSESERPRYALAIKYRGALEYLLDRPYWTLINTGRLFVFSIFFLAAFGSGVEFFPNLDPKSVSLSVTPPEGVSLDRAVELCHKAEGRILGQPGSGYTRAVANLKYVSTSVLLTGRSGGIDGVLSGTSFGPGRIEIVFVDSEERTESSSLTVSEIRRRLDGLDEQGEWVTEPLLGAEFDVITPEEGPPSGKPVSIDIYGEDLGVMAGVIDDMKRLMVSLPAVVKPTDNANVSQPTLEWKIDGPRAGIFSMGPQAVGQILQIAVGGLGSGTIGHGDDEQDILLRMPRSYRANSDRFLDMSLPLQDGSSVALSSMATVSLRPGPVSINHKGGRRFLSAGAELQPGVREDSLVRESFRELVRNYAFPAGITYEFGGASVEEAKAQAFLAKAFLIAIFAILMILVLQFDSLAVPLIVISSVVLSLIGVFLGLVVFRIPFGIILSGIGVISLAGVVVNNAIVLLDAIRRFEARGLP
ncbi:MAG: efflux RND transporter permease subunit, partial [Planctomycetes bacterium]|nr:efflux RND transporter permease subunit [Planctomycetota bacterium]